MNHTPAATSAITICYLGALATSYGCNGTEIDQYALYRTPRTSAEIDTDWARARAAARAAADLYAEKEPLGPIRPFNAHSSVTLGEHRQSLEARRRHETSWQERRRHTHQAAYTKVWQDAGAELIQLRYGSIDVADTSTPGGIPQVIHRQGCRCQAGDHHRDSTPSDRQTPPMAEIVLDTADELAVLCGTNRFVSFHTEPEAVQAALDAVRHAVAAQRATQENAHANLAARVVTPVETLEAMTFTELAEWEQHLPIGGDWPTAGRDLDGARRRWANRLAGWDAHLEAELTDTAFDAAWQQQLWAVGTPITND